MREEKRRKRRGERRERRERERARLLTGGGAQVVGARSALPIMWTGAACHDGRGAATLSVVLLLWLRLQYAAHFLDCLQHAHLAHQNAVLQPRLKRLELAVALSRLLAQPVVHLLAQTLV